MSALTVNSISNLCTSNFEKDTFKPTIQIINIKEVGTPTGQNTSQSAKRYRLVVSDGIHYMNGMLATQLNHLLDDTSPTGLSEFCVVRVDEFIMNIVSEKNVVILLNVQVLGNQKITIGKFNIQI